VLATIRRHPRRSVLIAAAACALALVAYAQSRWGPIDPTDPGYKVAITNNLSSSVRILDSKEDVVVESGRTQILEGLGPGQRSVRYEVTTLSGGRLGCINVTLDPSKIIVAKVSPLEAC
jgi:predicted SPOUT superfamily RNA methylase MTH1